MKDRWPLALVALHWLTALLIVGLVVVGSTMVDLAADDPLRRVLGRMHGVGGLSLGVLTLTRLLVRKLGQSPPPLPLSRLQGLFAGLVQGLLYVVLFGLSASGLGTAMGSDWGGFVGGDVQDAPVLSALLSRQVHGALVYALVALTGVHVIGVMLHQVRKGGALRRMVPFLR
ncbi:MAG: cytochrome b/b6 domain-containing protein [Myxococcales bacterium]|nr:cytochrome b/b6 domain-containing protein [Myxococcales bacterium]